MLFIIGLVISAIEHGGCYDSQWCLDEDERKKNVPGVLIVPNGTSTFSQLEKQKTKFFN